jgi:hydroxymethylbilane synthase
MPSVDSSHKPIIVAARASSLSRAQVQEVLNEFPAEQFECLYLETTGDKDLTTSLRTLDKTNFFTKEIDALQLAGKCRISIHSAKDLPDPLPSGLMLIALTRGQDSSDALVLRENETLLSLKKNAAIGTSSERREQAIRALREDFICVDIRGSIDKRLSLLDAQAVDGVVVAEAALIRLQLTHRNRIRLPGSTAPLQGKLAVLARSDDAEMRSLFARIDSR